MLTSLVLEYILWSLFFSCITKTTDTDFYSEGFATRRALKNQFLSIVVFCLIESNKLVTFRTADSLHTSKKGMVINRQQK